jgi:plasmid stabilization system protein ParE
MTARIDEAIWRLADMPGIGTLITVDRASLRGLRKAKVAGFAGLLIFYLADEEQLQVIRVLHAAQDWLGHLENDQLPDRPVVRWIAKSLHPAV